MTNHHHIKWVFHKSRFNRNTLLTLVVDHTADI